MDNLIVYAPFLSYSGYGTASRRFCYWLDNLRENLYFDEISFAITEPAQIAKPKWIEDYCKPLLGGDPIVLIWAIPTLFDKFNPPHAKLRIGSTCFEGDIITKEWADCCNKMDAILVPANKQAFEKGGVKVPILEMPYLPDHNKTDRRSVWNKFRFLTIIDSNTAYRKG